MKVNPNSLFQEMQALAQRAQGPNAELGAQQAVSNTSQSDFTNLLKTALDNVNELGQDSKDKAVRFEMGDKSVSLAETMIARQKSSVAFEATVQVRNKVVEAYREIMNMTV